MTDQKSVELLILFTPSTLPYPVLHRLSGAPKQMNFDSLPLNADRRKRFTS